jgi:PAS domain S-box-containing protein
LPFITTAVTLLVVEAASRGEPGNTPVVVFVLPILLSAYAGGLVPGLLSTVLSTLATVYFVLPPLHSIGVASPVDNIKWITLAAAGTLISFLMGRPELPGTEPLAQPSRPAGSLLLSVQRRVQAGFAVLLTCLVAMAAVSYPMLVRLREDTGWVEHSHQVIGTLRLLISSATGAESSERGYLITGSAEYLEPYQSAEQNVNQALDEVRRLTSDNREQQRRLADLKPLVEERLAVLHRAIELRNQSFALARDFVLSRRGGELKDRIRGIVAEMEATDQALLITREEAARRSTKLAKVEIVGGSALAVFIVAVALWMIGKAFTASRSAEAALEESRDQLEIRVNERTSALVESNELARASEQRLRRFYDSGLLGVIYWNINGEITDANDKFLEMVGYDREDLKAGRVDWTNITPPEYRYLDERSVEELKTTGVNRAPFEKEYTRKDGTRVPIVVAGAMLDEARSNGVAFVLDITERKRAEEAMRESEEHFRALATASSEVVYRMSADWSEMRHLVGRSFIPDTVAPDQTWLDKYIHPDDQSRVLAAINEAIRSKSIFELEHRVLRIDGSPGWTFSRAIPLLDANGEIVEWFGAAADITERKRAEVALRESEAQFRTLANAIPQLCWMANPDGWIFWYNDRWYQYTGTTAEQMEGWGWQSVHDPEALPGVLERWKGSIATGEPFDMVFPLRGADGVFRPFLTRIVPVRGAEGRVARWFGTNTDISEQRRIEENLRDSEAILQSFFDSPGVMRGMVELVGGQIVHISCNDAAAQIYGIKRDSIVGKTPTDTGATDELTRLWETLYEEARSTGKPVSHEYLRLDAQGRQNWHLTTVTSLGVGREGNSRFAYTTVDLTDRKQAEEALAQRAQELARSNADLAQFAYVASHDLKEPLRAVSGCVGLLKGQYEGKLDERTGEYMAHIVDGAARMEALIDGLLAYSRVGTQGGELQPVECAKALGMALQNLAASIEESGTVVTHDTLPAVNGDLPQLVSLFQNLIGNALKFRREASPRIHVSAERNGTHWRFFVRDNGIGIAPQYFERIFGVFQRLHTRREYPGTGIGLAVCKKIVERHGGQIWVESVPGEGATFCFSLLDAQTTHRQHGGEFHA